MCDQAQGSVRVPEHHPDHPSEFIVVHENDVLCGRGVNIAEHKGNERFRALVNTRHDESYCVFYTTSEKRAVAEEIIRHIKSLNPPGRFLKRTGRATGSRGLKGPWEELSDREALKKTCQALRDCNRQDRKGYAADVVVPEDVRRSLESRAALGLSNKEHATKLATRDSPVPQFAAMPSQVTSQVSQVAAPMHAPPPLANRDNLGSHSQLKRSRGDFAGRVSPSVEDAAEWLKKQRTNNHHHHYHGDPFFAATSHHPANAGHHYSDLVHDSTSPATVMHGTPLHVPPSHAGIQHLMPPSMHHPVVYPQANTGGVEHHNPVMMSSSSHHHSHDYPSSSDLLEGHDGDNGASDTAGLPQTTNDVTTPRSDEDDYDDSFIKATVTDLSPTVDDVVQAAHDAAAADATNEHSVAYPPIPLNF